MRYFNKEISIVYLNKFKRIIKDRKPDELIISKDLKITNKFHKYKLSDIINIVLQGFNISKSRDKSKLLKYLNGDLYIVTYKNELIGTLNYYNCKDDRYVFLSQLYIIPNYRNKGIGTSIINYMKTLQNILVIKCFDGVVDFMKNLNLEVKSFVYWNGFKSYTLEYSKKYIKNPTSKDLLSYFKLNYLRYVNKKKRNTIAHKVDKNITIDITNNYSNKVINMIIELTLEIYKINSYAEVIRNIELLLHRIAKPLYIIKYNNKPIGFINMLDSFNLAEIIILKEYRGQGIGTNVLKFINKQHPMLALGCQCEMDLFYHNKIGLYYCDDGNQDEPLTTFISCNKIKNINLLDTEFAIAERFRYISNNLEKDYGNDGSSKEMIPLNKNLYVSNNKSSYDYTLLTAIRIVDLQINTTYELGRYLKVLKSIYTNNAYKIVYHKQVIGYLEFLDEEKSSINEITLLEEFKNTKISEEIFTEINKYFS